MLGGWMVGQCVVTIVPRTFTDTPTMN